MSVILLLYKKWLIIIHVRTWIYIIYGGTLKYLNATLWHNIYKRAAYAAVGICFCAVLLLSCCKLFWGKFHTSGVRWQTIKYQSRKRSFWCFIYQTFYSHIYNIFHILFWKSLATCDWTQSEFVTYSFSFFLSVL